MAISAIADLETPTSLLLKLHAFKPAFLLESVTHGEKVGRYSFIGLDPIRTIEHRKGSLRELLERELSALNGEGLTAALVGAIGFDSAYETLPTGLSPRDQAGQPLAAFIVPRAVLTFDHVAHRISVEHADGPEAAAELLNDIRATISLPLPELPRGGHYSEPRPHIDEIVFTRMVTRAQEYIAAGDIFQVVLSLAFEGETTLHPYQIYRALRHLNPSPYLFYLDFGDYQIIGSSPEALVKLNNNNLTIRPIAGTRHRGNTESEDDALEAELLSDAKELAEHNMLVDLARNDVGRVAETGSVRTPDLRVIERYSHVMHICSTVTGKLAAKPLDAFMAAFPAGTVSGAPKISALRIIRELEPEPRGFYAGSVGYFTRDGDFDQAITIRTIVVSQGRYVAQAGAGIVADSVPANEYVEIQNKAAALLKALQIARDEL